MMKNNTWIVLLQAGEATLSIGGGVFPGTMAENTAASSQTARAWRQA
jgi:hypothetical protein